MKTITKTIKAYNFEELNDTAKEIVRQWYLDDENRIEDWKESVEEKIMYLFPNSDLHLQFSLCSCQGDGVNVYGTLSPNDLSTAIKKNPGLFKNVNYVDIPSTYDGKFHFRLPENRRYCYCMADYMKIVLDDDFDETLSEEAIEPIRKYAVDIFRTFCRKYEEYGYQFLYTASDDEIQDVCNSNGWMFHENGSFCFEADGRDIDENTSKTDSLIIPNLFLVSHEATDLFFVVYAQNKEAAVESAIAANKSLGESVEGCDLNDKVDYIAYPASIEDLSRIIENGDNCQYTKDAIVLIN